MPWLTKLSVARRKGEKVKGLGRHRKSSRVESRPVAIAIVVAASALVAALVGMPTLMGQPWTQLLGSQNDGRGEHPAAKREQSTQVSPTQGPSRAMGEDKRRGSDSGAERPRVPRKGPGTFELMAPERVDQVLDHSYTIEIETGIPLPAARTTRLIDAILSDERGWAKRGHAFTRTDVDPSIRILVATPATTDQLCAPLQTQGRVSCRNGKLVVLNGVRWARGIPDYRGDLLGYRRYLVNHEVGHALGQSHVSCPGPGRPAPVMMQQTYGLDECRKNPWP